MFFSRNFFLVFCFWILRAAEAGEKVLKVKIDDDSDDEKDSGGETGVRTDGEYCLKNTF